MDPLITNRLDPALLRIVDKRTNDREPPPRRRRPTAPERTPEEQEEAENPSHQLDDLA